jgi:hypothetical protein
VTDRSSSGVICYFENRFMADLQLANVEAGEKSWNKARLVFV